MCHLIDKHYRAKDYFNPVDKDDVPVPHFGICLNIDQFNELANKLSIKNLNFIIAPTLRFSGKPGEQWYLIKSILFFLYRTMFFKDPSGNNLEFKAMTNSNNLFAKYHIED